LVELARSCLHKVKSICQRNRWTHRN